MCSLMMNLISFLWNPSDDEKDEEQLGADEEESGLFCFREVEEDVDGDEDFVMR